MVRRIGVPLFACLCGGAMQLASLLPVSASAPASATKLLKTSLNAMTEARSVHVSVQVNAPTQKISGNVDVFQTGDLSGIFVLEGHRERLTVIQGTAYARISKAALLGIGMTARVAQEISSEWVSGPNSTSNGTGSQMHAAIGTSIDYAEFQHWVSELDSAPGLHDQGIHKIKGVGNVRMLAVSRGSYVDLSPRGKPLPMMLHLTAHGTTLAATFSKWNQQRLPVAPRNAVPISSFHTTVIKQI